MSEFSDDLLKTAAAIRAIRHALDRLVVAGAWPEGSFGDISTILVEGLAVAVALERLAGGSAPPRPGTGTLEDRR
jgi:hypothetical protein